MTDAQQFTAVASDREGRRSRHKCSARYAIIVLGLVAAACAPASGLSQAAVIPADRWLTTNELEALLPGNRIVEADAQVSYMRTPEEFHKNGSYVRHADNYEAHGKYRFKNDAVCDHALGEQEVCRKILTDDKGQYWIAGRDNPGHLTRITIQPLR